VSAIDDGKSLALGPRAVRLARVEQENYRVSSFVFDAAVEALPGQFGMFWLPGKDEKPFSLVAADPLTISVAAVGPFTRALHALPPGQFVGFRGPYGVPFQQRGRRLLLCGGGYGVAPLFFLARETIRAGCSVTMVTGAQTEEDLLFVQRFADAACPTVVTTDDGSAGRKGLASDAVADAIATERPDQLYGCGPEGLLVALARVAREHRIAAQLSVERYFKCAVGICGQCTVGELLACADGPVIAGDVLLAQDDFGRAHRVRTGALVPL
jgi:dihydroorotate dehydrogenase electron transfer subunit